MENGKPVSTFSRSNSLWVSGARNSFLSLLPICRSVKETLECRLFEAQQRLSQLEIARSHLEMQLHTVTQAREVIQGEVKCLQWELEAERSLLKQEREDAARQLLRTEQQHRDTLRLQESEHKVEMNKLLQDLAREREGHHSELQEMLEQWQKEKAETEGEHAKTLFDVKQKVATMAAQLEEERTRVEHAKHEVKSVKGELVWFFARLELFCMGSFSPSCLCFVSVLLEKEREKSAVLETLRQTEGELREAYQQLEQLRREVKEQQEKGQHITEKLQAELQEAQSTIKAVEKRHKGEISAMREEMQILHQQRDALQKQH
ncbi:centrosome-associated protein CEP250-like [Pluvialis apricaria]